MSKRVLVLFPLGLLNYILFFIASSDGDDEFGPMLWMLLLMISVPAVLIVTFVVISFSFKNNKHQLTFLEKSTIAIFYLFNLPLILFALSEM